MECPRRKSTARGRRHSKGTPPAQSVCKRANKKIANICGSDPYQYILANNPEAEHHRPSQKVVQRTFIPRERAWATGAPLSESTLKLIARLPP